VADACKCGNEPSGSVAANQLASQEGLYTMDQVTKFYIVLILGVC